MALTNEERNDRILKYWSEQKYLELEESNMPLHHLAYELGRISMIEDEAEFLEKSKDWNLLKD